MMETISSAEKYAGEAANVLKGVVQNTAEFLKSDETKEKINFVKEKASQHAIETISLAGKYAGEAKGKLNSVREKADQFFSKKVETENENSSVPANENEYISDDVQASDNEYTSDECIMNYTDEDENKNKRINHIFLIGIPCVSLALILSLLSFSKIKNNYTKENQTATNNVTLDSYSSEKKSVSVSIENNNEPEDIQKAESEISEPEILYNNELSEKAAVVGNDSYNEFGKFLGEKYTEYINEEGIVMGHPEKISDNSFAVCDIDCDGKNELLISIITGMSAANNTYIYKCDSSGKVVSEGTVYNGSEFFKNGFVKSPLSFNHGLSDSVWPYILFMYDSDKDEYIDHSSVNAWTKTDFPKDHEGNLFPESIDISSTGTVYYVTNSLFGKSEGRDKPLDYSEYVKWYNSWNENSPRIDMVYESFSIENIKKYNSEFSYVNQEEDISVPDNELQLDSDHNVENDIGKGIVSAAGDELFVRSSPEIINSPGRGNKIDSFSDGTELTIDYSRTSGTDKWLYVTGKGISGNSVSGYVYREFVKEILGLNSPQILNPYIKGEISSNGLSIEGFTTDYVCNGGEKTVQWNCEDTWHITARRTINSYGVQWYEGWDTDDGDYYGWIDGDFLYFY
ncbi:MAG: hypothetical protein ACI4KB_04625 [Oscillospiraceae bacterium]